MLRTKTKEKYFLAFFLAFAAACLCFLPFIIYDKGYFLFYGDFNVQQVPFYKMCHEMVRSGDIFWNWNTDLGANFIGSYSFYLLGSPFFWLTIPFPNWMVPHLIGPLLILKFSLASLTAYCYLRRFIKTPNYAVIGGLLYAFSGFSVYNIFFNHFHEAIVFFPLLLLAMELFVVERKRGPFIAAVFICAVSNYFFFFGMVIFALIYWVLRMSSGEWKMGMKDFLVMMLEAVIGVLLAAFLLVPSYLAVIENPRTDNVTLGWNALLYWNSQIFPNIIQSFFFPPDLPARAVFFPDAKVQWSSVAGWLPVFGMTGVIAFFCARKGHWIKRIIAVCAFMALIPILNSAFYMFNSAYYARWFYMPVLMMVLATLHTFENTEIDWRPGVKWSLFITLFFTVAIGLYPDLDDEGNYIIGLYNQSLGYRFWINCGIALVCLLMAWLIYPLLKKNKKMFTRLAFTAVLCISVIYTVSFIAMGKNTSEYTKGFVIARLLEPQEELDLPGAQVSRTDVYEGMDNTAMFFGLPTIQAFHSIVPQSVMDFYPYVGVERGVGSRPDSSHAALRTLLSVRYLLDYDETNGDEEDSFVHGDGEPRIAGFSFFRYQNGYNIYENTNFIPYGFTYDSYISKVDCDEYTENQREEIMLKALVLDDEQIGKYSDLLNELDEGEIRFGSESIAKDADARREESSTSFTRDRMGFTAEITLSKDNLVFFSVPYEEGWTATVDGTTAEIEKVNVGFMAVRVSEGTHTIRFNYMTPGLIPGCIVTGGAILLLAGYLVVLRWYRRSKKKEDEVYAPVPADMAYEDKEGIEQFLEEPIMNSMELLIDKQFSQIPLEIRDEEAFKKPDKSGAYTGKLPITQEEIDKLFLMNDPDASDLTAGNSANEQREKNISKPIKQNQEDRLEPGAGVPGDVNSQDISKTLADKMEEESPGDPGLPEISSQQTVSSDEKINPQEPERTESESEVPLSDEDLTNGDKGDKK